MSISDGDLSIEENVRLAGWTTFGVGGPASFFVRCPDTPSLIGALAWARKRHLPCFVLGGGSNLLVADQGFAGLVIQPLDAELTVQRSDQEVMISAAAGAAWDTVVEAAVAADGAGLEALSGIPGSAGAAPIQNIGAYGQELADCLTHLEVLDREASTLEQLPAAACGFAYRHSRFKADWANRYLITRIHLRLRRRGSAPARYAELRQHLGLAQDEPASLALLRQAVLELRRGKSMLFDPDDPNGRSAGSFFVNPVVPEAQAAALEANYRASGGRRELPRFAAPAGVKLSAAWLIEEAGFLRGYGKGRAGLSTRHTLAIVNRGGSSAADILHLAREIRAGVHQRFGIFLQSEPILLGFGPAELL